MRIAILSPTLGDAFGQERVLRETSRLLMQAGHSVYFLAEKKTGEIPPNTDYRFFTNLFTMGHFTSLLSKKAPHKEVLQYLKEIKADIVHFIEQPDAHTLNLIASHYPSLLSVHSVGLVCPASHRFTKNKDVCVKSSGPCCFFYHQSLGCLSHFKSPVHQIHALMEFELKRRATEKLKLFCPVSKYLNERMIIDGFDSSKIQTVYNPVSLPKLEEKKRNPNLLLFSARLMPIKGLDYLFHALDKIKTLPWTLAVYGDGPMANELKALCQKLNLTLRVSFKGRGSFEEIERARQEAGIYAQPNLGPEGFGLSFAEASASALPITSFKIPAIDEIVEDGKTGFLAPAKDIEALSNHLAELLQKHLLARDMGEKGRKRIATLFSPEKYLTSILECYQRCLNT